MIKIKNVKIINSSKARKKQYKNYMNFHIII